MPQISGVLESSVNYNRPRLVSWGWFWFCHPAVGSHLYRQLIRLLNFRKRITVFYLSFIDCQSISIWFTLGTQKSPLQVFAKYYNFQLCSPRFIQSSVLRMELAKWNIIHHSTGDERLCPWLKQPSQQPWLYCYASFPLPSHPPALTLHL